MKTVIRIAVLGVGLVAAFAQSPPKPPIVREGFLRAVEIGGLTEDELIFYVSDRGVDFKLTGEERARVAKAGLGEKLFEALEKSYRAPKGAKAPEAGAPIGQEELLGWLRDGYDADSVEHAVEQRGVAFEVTPELSRGLESAGVRRSLIGVLFAKQQQKAPVAPVAAKPAPEPVQPPRATLPPPVAPVPSAVTQTPAAEEPSLYVIRRVKPAYPADAKKGLSGLVRLKVLVNADGRVENVEPLEGPAALVTAAEQAVRKWIYEPPIVKGKPSSAETIVKINFKAP
ncbi:MAG: TonB family protein [Bryobacteraceae bacterium]